MWVLVALAAFFPFAARFTGVGRAGNISSWPLHGPFRMENIKAGGLVLAGILSAVLLRILAGGSNDALKGPVGAALSVALVRERVECAGESTI